MVAIVILNWNGYKDTIECLKSLYKMDYNDFFIIVGDNGSTDDSVVKITEWCKNNLVDYKSFQLGDDPPFEISQRNLILYEMNNNLGFSKGNNSMIKFISSLNPDFYFLLNNDTEVLPKTMSSLIDFANSHPKYKVLTPQIRYFYDKSKIWNCGGNILWGIRKYNYVNKHYSKIKESIYLPCSFITGCALLFKSDILMEDGNLFTENFFFGEEDFELCLRMKKKHIDMACFLPSILYHKVGTSTKSTKSLKRSFIYYLNRFIDMRNHMNWLEYCLWKILYTPYVFRLIMKEQKSIGDSFKFICRLLSETSKKDGVSKEYFEKIWNSTNLL